MTNGEIPNLDSLPEPDEEMLQIFERVRAELGEDPLLHDEMHEIFKPSGRNDP